MKTTQFSKRIAACDEKWIVCNNVTRKRSWPKPDEPAQRMEVDLHQNKVMLSICWDYKGVIYFEVVPKNQNVNSEDLKKKRRELASRKGAVFHQDYARPYTSLATRRKLLELGWELMLHPPYSPDLAPSDHHLLRSVQNNLNAK
ncbi:transposase [Necator americanus]|uniref:Transposase n=1 Tax=Necator americanus TaxID=51031 RepID=W2SMJ2_NECAM|nr:transposase [Necator americanus]ETN70743.1 transposase [Necator americanus]